MPPELVTLTIDGTLVQAPKGRLLIEVCAEQGIYIPRFCYHEHLVPYAGCRMCLVDVEKMPKLATACSTPVAEGMVVHTSNEKVKLAREGILEFILVSHPLDCPVCDKGGECDLQDQTFLYGREDSRVVDVKRFHHNADLSSTIKLDYNRCILCKRCVRFTEEIGDDDRLIFRERGAHTEISTQTGEAFNSRFGGTVIEYCPVGALTDQVFRFRARPWEIKEKPSNCGNCAMNCASTLHVRSNNVVRIFNRTKADLNGYYICDKGRFNHEFKDHPERLTEPLLRKNGRLVPVSWEEALTWAGQELARVVQLDGPHSVAGIIGAERSLEDQWNFKGLLEALGSPHLDHTPSLAATPAQSAFFLNRVVPYQQVLDSKHLLLWDSHLFDELPMLGLRLKQSRMGMVAEAWGPTNPAAIRSIAGVRTYHSRYSWTTETVVARHLQTALLVGVAQSLSGRGRLSRELQAALSQATDAVRINNQTIDQTLIEELATWLWQDDAILTIGHQPLLQDPALLELLELVIRVRESVRGKPLGLCLGVPEANSLGALALRIQPRWDKRGPVGQGSAGIFAGITAGDLKGLVLAGGDHAHRLAPDTIEALGQLRCFIACSYFLDEVTAQAHCVLPALTWYEGTGLTLNGEGRIQEIVRGTTPRTPGWKSIAEWTADLALQTGHSLPMRSMDIRASFETKVPGMKSLHQVGGAVDGWRQSVGTDAPSVEFRALVNTAPEPGPQELRLRLRRGFWNPGAVLEHSPLVQELEAPFEVRMHPADAKRLGCKPGDHLTLSTALGHVRAPVSLTRGVPEGYVDAPEGHAEARLLTLGALQHGVLLVTADRASVPQEVATV